MTCVLSSARPATSGCVLRGARMATSACPLSSARPATSPGVLTRRRRAAGERGVPGVAGLLATAVSGIGGAERPGQVTMTEAVNRAIETGEHLAVQAGTGTGKSLAYLVPAVRHAVTQDATVVVSTATIALQRQLIDRDLPRLAKALAPVLGRAPVFAILKGRRNYLCLQRLRMGAQDEPQDALFDPRTVSAVGKQVTRLHAWAETTKTGDRDELVPGVSEQAWRQVAVTARECVGAQRCPFGTQCFAEQAREEAGRADVVVTNHALLAIDALENFIVLPEHDAVIIDEAHDLVDRVTSVASAELSAAAAETAARRCGRMIEEKLVARLKEAGEDVAQVLAEVAGGRLDVLAEALATSLESIRDAAGACAADFRGSTRSAEEEPRTDGRAPVCPRRARRAAGCCRPDSRRVRRGYRRAAGRGVDGPAAGAGGVQAADPSGGAAAGRRPASGALVRPAHGGADLRDPGARGVFRAAGPAVGSAQGAGHGPCARSTC